MAVFEKDKIKALIAHWESKTPLTTELQTYWITLSTAQRREIRHNYQYETNDDL